MSKILFQTTLSNITSVTEFVRWFSATIDQIVSQINGDLDHTNIDCFQFKNTLLSEVAQKADFNPLVSSVTVVRHGLGKKPIAYLNPSIIYDDSLSFNVFPSTDYLGAFFTSATTWDDKQFTVTTNEIGKKRLRVILYG